MPTINKLGAVAGEPPAWARRDVFSRERRTGRDDSAVPTTVEVGWWGVVEPVTGTSDVVTTGLIDQKVVAADLLSIPASRPQHVQP